MTERRLSKKASVTLVAILLLASAGVATAAATGATDTVLPMLQGKFSAYERGLSRHSAALAVHVSEFDGENKTPVAGATVSVYRVTHQAQITPTIEVYSMEGEPDASKETDADGRAVFELRPGRYDVRVAYDDRSAHHVERIGKDTRVGVVFDADGEARWYAGPRSDVADRGEPVPLMIRVGGTDGETRYPIENATVKILKAVRDDDGKMTFDTVAENRTQENGGVAFHLLPGPYFLDITTPDGLTGEKPLRLHEPTGVMVLFDAEGDAHFGELHRDDRFDGKPPHHERDGEPRPMTRPTPTREPRPMP